MRDRKIFNPVVVRRPVEYQGSLKSSDYNDTQEEVVSDIYELSNIVNSLYSDMRMNVTILQNENQYLRRRVDALKEQQTYSEKMGAQQGSLISRLVDFSNTEGIQFPNGLDDSRSAMLTAEYGEITLPVKSVENKFFSISVADGRVITPPNLDINVRGRFDKGQGEGLVDYEKGGKVYPGQPRNAFNGINDSYWVRRVEFPLYSNVDDVEVELTVTVPEGTSSTANSIEILPFPNGSMDITELATASDLGNNYTRVEGFSPVDNVVARRYHFPSKVVEKIKIRLRQRNWVEENGKKVFYYGLQELALKLSDYDKSYTLGSAFGNNNSFIVKIPAPSGYIFQSINRIDPKPNFLLEEMSKRHVHMKLGTNSDPSSSIFWDSDALYPPQNTGSPIEISTSVIYAFVEMNFVENSGGSLSPYLVGTTPFLKSIGFVFNLSEI